MQQKSVEYQIGQLREALDRYEETPGGNKCDHAIELVVLLHSLSDTVLMELVTPEYPQTIALILSMLPPERASGILLRLPVSQAGEVANRIKGLPRTSPDVMAAVVRILVRKFKMLISRNDAGKIGGEEFLAQMLAAMSKEDAKHVSKMMKACGKKGPGGQTGKKR